LGVPLGFLLYRYIKYQDHSSFVYNLHRIDYIVSWCFQRAKITVYLPSVFIVLLSFHVFQRQKCTGINLRNSGEPIIERNAFCPTELFGSKCFVPYFYIGCIKDVPYDLGTVTQVGLALS
jgi:hypothetical protein